MGKTGWQQAGVFGLGLALASPAMPCAFHGYTPDPTLVDLLLDTEQVVTARIASTGTARYVPQRVLAGPAISEIPIPVDATTQARLAAAPEARVLLARDGAYGPWTELAVLEDGFAKLVDQVMARQAVWQLGGDAERLRLFAPRVNDKNPDIRRLALQELDRAAYGALRDLRLPRVQHLARDLQSGEKELRPIRILLAGLSGEARFGPILRAGLAEALAQGVPHLGAYATALIELEGKAGVAHLVQRYLMPNTLSWDAREKLFEALAIQYRAGAPATRRLISREVARLSRQSPDLREAAARQFGTQDRWRPSDGAEDR